MAQRKVHVFAIPTALGLLFTAVWPWISVFVSQPLFPLG